jgi:hypothetical protein
MSHFFCRLNPPRPTFAQDATDAERELMARHAAYWREHLDAGRAEIFGLVGDPAGAWGFAIANVADRAAASALTNGDPVIIAAQGFSYDVFPMPRGAVMR